MKEQQHTGAFTFTAFAMLQFKRSFRGITLQQAKDSYNLAKINDNFLLRIQKCILNGIRLTNLHISYPAKKAYIKKTYVVSLALKKTL